MKLNRLYREWRDSFGSGPFWEFIFGGAVVSEVSKWRGHPLSQFDQLGLWGFLGIMYLGSKLDKVRDGLPKLEEQRQSKLLLERIEEEQQDNTSLLERLEGTQRRIEAEQQKLARQQVRAAIILEEIVAKLPAPRTTS